MTGINELRETKQMQEGGLESSMDSIYNSRGKEAGIDSYRPVTVTSVVYRFILQATKSEIQSWMEENEIFRELQNTCKQEWQLDDNLIAITQCLHIEIAQSREFWIAFWDSKWAYGNVNR